MRGCEYRPLTELLSDTSCCVLSPLTLDFFFTWVLAFPAPSSRAGAFDDPEGASGIARQSEGPAEPGSLACDASRSVEGPPTRQLGCIAPGPPMMTTNLRTMQREEPGRVARAPINQVVDFLEFFFPASSLLRSPPCSMPPSLTSDHLRPTRDRVPHRMMRASQVSSTVTAGVTVWLSAGMPGTCTLHRAMEM